MTQFMRPAAAIAAICALFLITPDSHAQMTADVSVEVTQGPDGIYTYDYMIDTSFLSSLAVDWFQLDVANGSDVVEGEDVGFFIRSLDTPANWVGEYQPYMVEYDQDFNITGVQMSGNPPMPRANDMEVVFLAGDGLICDHPAGGVLPGTMETFSIRSPYGPGTRDFVIGKTDPFCEFLGFETGEILAPTTPPEVEEPSCDFNGDEVCDLADIDLLGTAIAEGSMDLSFDLNADSLVDASDLDSFLATAGVNKPNGDANFDGEVAFSDFLTLSSNFNKTPAVWSEGDFAPNGVVEFADFLLLSSNFGATEAAAAAASVPEPSAAQLLLISAAVGLLCTRRRR